MTIRPQHVKKEAAPAPTQANAQAGSAGPEGAACAEGNQAVEPANNHGGLTSRVEGPLGRDSPHQQLGVATAGQKRRHRTSPHRHRKRASLGSPSSALTSTGCQPGPSHASLGPGSSVVSSCSAVSGMLKSSSSMSCQLSPLPALASLDDLSSLSPLGNLSSSLAPGASDAQGDADNEFSAYNSGDEYDRPDEANVLSEREMAERELRFELLLRSKGLTIKKMEEDGACLFRAVADQIYGDQGMHGVVRKLCMDYLTKNADYFSHYLTEPFDQYVERKRRANAHGNHIEMHALSEMYNRPIEIYHYSEEPINIFHGSHKSGLDPIRLSYHRGVHYNSIVDPFKATIGVGLGLPGFQPGLADKDMLVDAIRASEHTELERQMLKDKLLATDWEATTEALERQVAQESYLEYLRENERRTRKRRSATGSCGGSGSTANHPSGEESPRGSASPRSTTSGRCSPKSAAHSSQQQTSSPTAQAGVSVVSEGVTGQMSPRHSPRFASLRDDGAGGRQSPMPCSSTSLYASHNSGSIAPNSQNSPRDSPRPSSSRDHVPSTAKAVENTRATFMNNNFPPEMFGLEDYDDSVLARVLAESQEEYFRQLKKQQQQQQQQQQTLYQQQSSGNSGTGMQSGAGGDDATREHTNEGASTSRYDPGSNSTTGSHLRS
ncbi:OTU domain-containing protein 5-A-like [Tropilaelaps mercedesae]|uniref:ubiquitinyl hydrolase 1 n=1 Tax=Tropilaelaps mercedesae TaxID=418985 RepID=A0A1V9XI97_9ACAR|nr:OTU domain-containing protein 5-A-like [Tropilaelaps mercedesae]